jgi:2-phosphosulfolactate phosphatase
MIFDQQEFDIRFEWGQHGVAVLAPISDVVIIVDVLSFSTSVDIAVSRGAIIFPYRGPAEGLGDYAAMVEADVADHRRGTGSYTLSPTSLLNIAPGTRLVLPSPNGSTLTLGAKPTPVLAGCLRNAGAIALAARRIGPKIAGIAAGDRWRIDRSLRPSLGDLLGAGAWLSELTGRVCPEDGSGAATLRALRGEGGV